MHNNILETIRIFLNFELSRFPLNHNKIEAIKKMIIWWKISLLYTREKNKYQIRMIFFPSVIYRSRWLFFAKLKFRFHKRLDDWSLKEENDSRDASSKIALASKELLHAIFLDVTLLYIHNQMTFVQKTLLCICVKFSTYHRESVNCVKSNTYLTL